MSSNAWDRAQRAITRAEARDAAVVTPDNAVSPFDASATTVIPHADLPGRPGAGRHQRPEDATTEVQAAPSPDGAPSGRRRRPSPRPTPGTADGAVPHEPPTAPVDLGGPDDTDHTDDAPTEDVATSPYTPLRARPRPTTSPFEAVAGGGAEPDVAGDPSPPRRRGFWARLFGRR